jgi:hypothetical protein
MLCHYSSGEGKLCPIRSNWFMFGGVRSGEDCLV